MPENRSMAMKKKSGCIVITAVVLLAALLLAGCGAKEPAAPAPQAPAVVTPPPVEVAVAVRERQQPERDPFVVAEAGAEAREMGEVEAAGRDPFAPVENVVLPEKPDEPVVPVDPVVPPVDPPVPPDPTGVTPGLVAVQMTAIDRCWIDVYVDNERVLRTNMPNGETLTWEGKQVRLEQVGREKALLLTLNGRYLGVVSELVPELLKGPKVYEFEGARVRVSLEHRYSGGVLVGLKFEVI
jgi:hypothetical protein